MSKHLLVAILAGTLAISQALAKDEEEKSDQGSPVVATVNGEPISKAEWSAIMKADAWYGPTFKQKPPFSEQMQGKPYEDFFFKEEVVKIRVMAQKYKDALPQMKNAIDAIYKKAKAGEEFAELARQYSQDGLAARGGEVGRIEVHEYVFPFNRIALSLKEGEMSEPFLTIFGYHIVKVEKVFPAVSSEAKGKSVQARHILIKYPSSDARRESEDLAKQAKVEVLDKGLCKKLVSYCAKES